MKLSSLISLEIIFLFDRHHLSVLADVYKFIENPSEEAFVASELDAEAYSMETEAEIIKIAGELM